VTQPVRVRRLLAGAASLLLVGGLVGVPGPAGATTSGVPGDVTTSSTKVVSWLDQAPRNPGDGPSHPEVYDKLKDWKLRVSQTKDLLNQTVEVSWAGGGTSGNGTYLALMQCWSDGPTVQPTREQCAYGGIDRDGASGSGEAKTRAIAGDPRETTYRSDGDLRIASVNGSQPPSTGWSENASIVLGTDPGGSNTCPSQTTGYTVTLTPPAHPQTVAKLVIAGPTTTPPGSATVGSQTFPVATPAFSMADLAQQASVASWPDGDYRVILTCDVAGQTVAPSTFVGFVSKVTNHTGTQLWQPSGHETGVFVPFDPLGNAADLARTDPYERDQILDYVQPRTSNEIWQAKNRSDGSGDIFMEMLTDLEAQHLGCGRVEPSGPRACWLVAVPRWAGDPNGSEPIGAYAASPLSQTLWDRRIAVPLAFAPVASGCKIGSGLKQVLAHDSALSALRSWQPTFCGNPATASSVLGPLEDDAVRGFVSSPNRLGVATVPPQGIPTLVTAPLTTSGVVVGFSVDRRVPYGSPKYGEDGTRADVMNLNPRLLAKLLTQSYDSGAAPNGGKTSGYNSSVLSGDFQPTYYPARNFPKDNPRRLYDDPEFLRLNPAFADWLNEGASLSPEDMADVLVSANSADAYNVLWRWILADKEAKAFLDGVPDPDGMRVNPYYKGRLTADTSSFLQLDPTCVDNIADPAADDFPRLCEINDHPRSENDDDSAQAAVRGDTKRVNQPPPVFTSDVLAYKAEARQQQGGHGMIVITNSAVAERYGLPTARLRNSAGNYIGATAAGLAASRNQMPHRSDGILLTDPSRVTGQGYPLTTMSYAMVDVAASTRDQDAAFAKILDYAAGPGQVQGTAIGQLPPGYAPLSAALEAQTRAAAVLLRDPSSLLPQSGDGGSTGATPSAAPVPGVLPGSVVPPVIGPPTILPPSGQAAPTLASPVSLTGRVASTLPYVLPGLLLLAGTCLLASRVLRHQGRSHGP
jgi:hypothetical protein